MLACKWDKQNNNIKVYLLVFIDLFLYYKSFTEGDDALTFLMIFRFKLEVLMSR